MNRSSRHLSATLAVALMVFASSSAVQAATADALPSGVVSFELLKAGKQVASGSSAVSTAVREASMKQDSWSGAAPITLHSPDLVYRDTSSRGYVKSCQVTDGKTQIETGSLQTGKAVQIDVDKLAGSDKVLLSATVDVQEDQGDRVFDAGGCKIQTPTSRGARSSQRVVLKLGEHMETKLEDEYALVVRYDLPK